MELELRGKSNIQTDKWYKADLLDSESLPVNKSFKKIVLLKGYSTQVNKFDDSSYDVIYNFKDGKGLELQPRSFSLMNTSNSEAVTGWLDANINKAVWLEGSLIQKGDRTFIDVTTLNSDRTLKEITPEVFEAKVEGIEVMIERFTKSTKELPKASRLYSEFQSYLNTQPLPQKGTVNKAGACLVYLTEISKLLNSVVSLEEKDNLVVMEMLYLLKRNENINKKELIDWAYDNLEGDIHEEVLLGIGENEIQTVQGELLGNLRAGIWTAMSYSSWAKLGGKTHYNPITREEVKLRR